jgi:hypothetical protein
LNVNEFSDVSHTEMHTTRLGRNFEAKTVTEKLKGYKLLVLITCRQN